MDLTGFHLTTDERYSRFFLAINHYMAVADHIGTGLITEYKNGQLAVGILVQRGERPHEVQDRRDFAAFRAAVEALPPGDFGATLTHEADEVTTLKGFDLWVLRLPSRQTDAFAWQLVREEGPKGWGSTKKLVDEHFPDVRNRIKKHSAL